MPDLTGGPAVARPRSRPRTAARKDATDDCDLPTVAAWKKGKGEIPIAARFKGPGPAAYSVPSTFATPYVPNKAPAWTFGVRLHTKDDTSMAPGPGSFYPRVTRNGHIGGPAFSIQGRFRTGRSDGKGGKGDTQRTDTPGPAAYSIKNAVPNPLNNPPAYTMLGRTPLPKADNNPGPAQYNIGATIGTKVPTGPSAPANSILGQRIYKVVSNSPGPAMYNTPEASRRILKSAPAYSLGYRITKHPASSRLSGPGPANYSPLVRMKTREAPSFSFGVRHSDYEAFVVAGPEDVGF